MMETHHSLPAIAAPKLCVFSVRLTSMKKRNFLSRMGSAITRTRNFVMNTFFVLILLFLIVAGLGSLGGPNVPEDAALVLNPKGVLVEETVPPDPWQSFWAGGDPTPTANVNELVRAVDHAAKDSRIRLILLDLDDLAVASPAHAKYLGDALQRFRDADKQVISFGHSYSQSQYAIASFADTVYLHPFGGALFPGYGIYRTYLRGLLDKLDINAHVFRVGAYKSAVEPVTEQAMPPLSKEVNQALVDNLWRSYRELIVANRTLAADGFDHYTASYDEALMTADGDMARLALEFGLVDELMTPDHVEDRIAAALGQASGTDDYPSIGYRSYLQTLPPDLPKARNLGLIFAQGGIETGDNRNAAASDNLVDLIRQARKDESVAALVLRINSGGGSAFASELIRQELELTQLADKPVVASLGPVAASGGYWLAATADRIVAHPTTLTGSIGVIGLFLTFEDSVANIGVQSDGVGSLPVSDALHPLRPLSDPAQRILTASVRHTYDRFLNLVAKGRDMQPQTVDEIAQGRVWSGQEAHGIGLVDELGDLPRALAAAAEIAEVEDYGVKVFSTPASPLDQLVQNLMESADVQGPAAAHGIAGRLLRASHAQLALLPAENGVYAICEACVALSDGG